MLDFVRAPNRVHKPVLTIAGVILLLCFAGMAVVGDLRTNLVAFLALNGAACLVYGGAAWWAVRAPGDRRTLTAILAFAVLFRVALLFSTPPTLSDDVYRYMWDGHLLNAGTNPYAYRVDSPALDPLTTPFRSLVNHNWMASPYLPVAQIYFAGVAAIAPGSALTLQAAALLLDLLTGLIVIDLLRRLGLPATHALIYLWNPLTIVESAHSAHVDSLMICLMMAALWALAARRSEVGSGLTLAAATLTKGIPVLLVPVLLRRWGWRGALAFTAGVVALCAPFVLGAGAGLGGPSEGTGLFGAIRIYASQWTFNSGLHHWLEVLLSGNGTADAAPVWASRAIMSVLMAATLAGGWVGSWRRPDGVSLLQLALIPLSGYLLLTTTVHPWYVTVIIPLIPYLLGRHGQRAKSARFAVPWLAFSALVPLSYLTYLDPANLREYSAVRLAQYVPLYLLLVWAARPVSGELRRPGQAEPDATLGVASRASENADGDTAPVIRSFGRALGWPGPPRPNVAQVVSEPGAQEGEGGRRQTAQSECRHSGQSVPHVAAAGQRGADPHHEASDGHPGEGGQVGHFPPELFARPHGK